MDIANQFQKKIIFLTEDRFVAVLKKVSNASIPAVKSYHVSGQNLSHDGGNGSIDK
jgi:hypothetical protein